MRLPLPTALLLLANAPPPPPAPQTTPAVLGLWANPKKTLVVRTDPCGAGLCGQIVWAAPRALADARDAGIPHLLGTQLLQDYRPDGAREWAGRVYVPDMGRTFSSRLRQDRPDRLVISGCLVGGWLCKSQVWHRAP